MKAYQAALDDNRKKRRIPESKQGVKLDKQALQAYERYVVAQFRCSSAEEMAAERKQAIESLIPGTLDYYHLYFLDLVKQKKTLEEFSAQEKKMYQTFNSQFGQTAQFYEIEMRILLLNRLEELPRVDQDASKEDIQANLELIEYLQENYLKQTSGSAAKPDWIDDLRDEASDGQASGHRAKHTHDFAADFSRAKKTKEIMDSYSKHQRVDNWAVLGFENDVDWDQVLPEQVYQHATWLA